jgi:CBS domain-containing protein
MDNAAFEDDPLEEVARILRAVADRIESGNDEGPVRDENGNTVGRFSVTLEVQP